MLATGPSLPLRPVYTGAARPAPRVRVVSAPELPAARPVSIADDDRSPPARTSPAELDVALREASVRPAHEGSADCRLVRKHRTSRSRGMRPSCSRARSSAAIRRSWRSIPPTGARSVGISSRCTRPCSRSSPRYGAQLVGVSVDGVWVPCGLRRRPRAVVPAACRLRTEGRGVEMFGAYRRGDGVSERALFVLDDEGIIRWCEVVPPTVNPGAAGILSAARSPPCDEKVRNRDGHGPAGPPNDSLVAVVRGSSSLLRPLLSVSRSSGSPFPMVVRVVGP